ncbi:hypothetical protein ACFIN9_27040 [Streptomyces noursei]|uniref:hypothetical protein n=1 Tax=Streptomyces noursei TaxID=1971 RepID=UPI000B2D46F7
MANHSSASSFGAPSPYLAFMAARAGRALRPEEQAEYEQLLTAWADFRHPS